MMNDHLAAPQPGRPPPPQALAQLIHGHYDFSSFHTLVDVGGGQGILLAAILHAHRHVRGILFDQPAVIAGVRGSPRLDSPEIAGRLELRSGSFFESLPG